MSKHPTPTGADGHNFPERRYVAFGFTPPFCWEPNFSTQAIILSEVTRPGRADYKRTQPMKKRTGPPRPCNNPLPVVAALSPPTVDDILDAIGLGDVKRDGWCCEVHYVRYLREKYDLA